MALLSIVTVGLFRRRTDSTSATAKVAVYGEPTLDRTEGARVTWEGDEWLVPFLPAAYIDKILSSVRGSDAEDLFATIYEFVLGRKNGWTGDPADAMSGEVSLIDGGDDEQEVANVRIVVRFSTKVANFGAETHFKPLTAANPEFAQLCLAPVWDWTCRWISRLGDGAEVYALLENLQAQCIMYREDGLPTPFQVGFAPFAGAHYMAEIRRDQDREIPLLDEPILG